MDSKIGFPYVLNSFVYRAHVEGERKVRKGSYGNTKDQPMTLLNWSYKVGKVRYPFHDPVRC